MNKTELTIKLARRTGLTQGVAGSAVDALFGPSGVITGEMVAGRPVTIPGFGSFSVHDRPAREARNPATGEKISVPERRYPTFKAGKTLKDKIGK